MPNYKKAGDPTAKIGDTVTYQGKAYKVIASDNGKRTINLESPIEISNPVIDKFVNTDKYKPLSTTKWDKSMPKTADVRPGTNLDKQNRSDLLKTELKASFDKNTRSAVLSSLNIFETAMKNNALTKKELQQIFAPPSAMPPGKTEKGGLASRFNLNEIVEGGGKSKKNVVFDYDTYGDINKLRNEITKRGAEFFIARTNLNATNEEWQKINEEYESGKINLNEFNKKLELARVRNDDSQNYLKQVINRINTWKAKNSDLSFVRRAIEQSPNLDYDLAMADLNSLNIQDAKNWRIQAKNRIIEDMYNNLKDKKEIKDEFGTPKFDENGKLSGYSMEDFYNQLSNSFDVYGNYDPNYIPYTNYTRKFNQVKDRLEKVNKELYPEEFKNSGIPFLEGLYERNAGKPFKNLPASTAAQLGLKFQEAGARPINDSDKVNPLTGKKTYWDEKVKSAQELELPIYEIDHRNKAYNSIALTPESFGKDIQREFSKAVYNLYTDKDDRNVINIPTPFFANYGSSGLGAKALIKEINLADTKGDSPWIWQSFIGDWSRSKSGLSTKINGVNRKISFQGAGQDGYDESDEEQSEKGIALINNFIEWSQNPKNDTEANSFIMEAYKYANDNKDNSAMTLFFPEKFLKQQVADKVIDDTDKELILSKGASIIGKQDDFNNELIKSTRSNLQAHIDYNKYYSYKDPSGLAGLDITKDEEGDYTLSITLRNPINNKKLFVPDYSTRFGDELDDATLNAMKEIQKYINKVSKINTTNISEQEEESTNNRGYLQDFGL